MGYRTITQREYIEHAVERKRRKLALLEQEIAALEQMVALLSRTEEIHIDQGNQGRERELS